MSLVEKSTGSKIPKGWNMELIYDDKSVGHLGLTSVVPQVARHGRTTETKHQGLLHGPEEQGVQGRQHAQGPQQRQQEEQHMEDLTDQLQLRYWTYKPSWMRVMSERRKTKEHYHILSQIYRYIQSRVQTSETISQLLLFCICFDCQA